jgi:hypothetical protein
VFLTSRLHGIPTRYKKVGIPVSMSSFHSNAKFCTAVLSVRDTSLSGRRFRLECRSHSEEGLKIKTCRKERRGKHGTTETRFTGQRME